MTRPAAGLATLALVALAAGGAAAQEMAWRPLSPSFGGDAFTGNFLLSTAQIQNRHLPKAPPPKEVSDQEQFLASVKSRVYSRLASQVTDMVFGENPQENGTIKLGEQTITYERVGSEIVMRIVENGQTTELRFPVAM